MKKIFMMFVIGIFLLVFGLLVFLILFLFLTESLLITAFNNSLTAENLTFAGKQNLTRYLDLPKFANITYAVMNFSGLIREIGPTKLYEYFLIGDNEAEVEGSQPAGQVFKVGNVSANEDFYVVNVSARVCVSGSEVPANISFSIYSIDANGHPSGSPHVFGVVNSSEFYICEEDK